jgi:hypothetical protein
MPGSVEVQSLCKDVQVAIGACAIDTRIVPCCTCLTASVNKARSATYGVHHVRSRARRTYKYVRGQEGSERVVVYMDSLRARAGVQAAGVRASALHSWVAFHWSRAGKMSYESSRHFDPWVRLPITRHEWVSGMGISLYSRVDRWIIRLILLIKIIELFCMVRGL